MVVRLRADQVALVRQQGDRVRARHGGEEGLALPAHRRDRRGHRRSPGAHDDRHLGDVNQLARRAYRRLRIGLIVLDDQLDLAAEQSAGGVHLRGDRLHGFQHARPVEPAGTGQRREHAELQRSALRLHHGRGEDTRCQRRRALQRRAA
jgi:hypothetical protein